MDGLVTDQVRAERMASVDQTDDKAPSVKEMANLFRAKGASSTSSTSISAPAPLKIVKAQRKTVAPKFVTPLVGVIVEQNAHVVMEAIIDGKDHFHYACGKQLDLVKPSKAPKTQ